MTKYVYIYIYPYPPRTSSTHPPSAIIVIHTQMIVNIIVTHNTPIAS